MKNILIGIASFVLAGAYFYGLDHWLMSVQGLSVGYDLMPK